MGIPHNHVLKSLASEVPVHNIFSIDKTNSEPNNQSMIDSGTPTKINTVAKLHTPHITIKRVIHAYKAVYYTK